MGPATRPGGRPATRRAAAVALPLVCALLLTGTGCGGDKKGSAEGGGASPTSSVERQKFAKTRFVANAGLAAGASYQWIIKPYRAGAFKKGADGRTVALVKAGLAGTFAYNRFKAALNNAKGDPTLSKAVAPLSAGVESLKGLTSKFRKGEATDGDAGAFDGVINSVKNAGKDAGAPVTDKVPSYSEIQKG
ncbi:hypothetical protein GO001_24095 [Streptomyces sp. NRRL B-1677]|uniref:Lipoprotein n=1 Tax=Streptomyces klenkii TaxID=1420899 RepID=A0A3B0BRS0_9ACTN|nr:MULTISPECIES: hypothetical protein [Streptomyces]MBF6048259.1 hypothetical protein [Streptomyces sp. NRRL B-1677]RKN75540.1 hypothetical protein D7231_08955 [Streptomyces klenkii]